MLEVKGDTISKGKRPTTPTNQGANTLLNKGHTLSIWNRLVYQVQRSKVMQYLNLKVIGQSQRSKLPKGQRISNQAKLKGHRQSKNGKL